MHDRKVRTARLACIVVTAVGAAGIVGLSAGRAAADAWSNENCRVGWSFPVYWKRSGAASYTQPPLREGYSLNGGCYKLNDRDDTPSLPAGGGGEGTDCSGFVFRTWALKIDGTNGYKRWDYQHDVHGPWYSWDYKDPAGRRAVQERSGRPTRRSSGWTRSPGTAATVTTGTSR